jgi:hypothetical protein
LGHEGGAAGIAVVHAVLAQKRPGGAACAQRARRLLASDLRKVSQQSVQRLDIGLPRSCRHMHEPLPDRGRKSCPARDIAGDRSAGQPVYAKHGRDLRQCLDLVPQPIRGQIPPRQRGENAIRAFAVQALQRMGGEPGRPGEQQGVRQCLPQSTEKGAGQILRKGIQSDHAEARDTFLAEPLQAWCPPGGQSKRIAKAVKPG